MLAKGMPGQFALRYSAVGAMDLDFSVLSVLSAPSASAAPLSTCLEAGDTGLAAGTLLFAVATSFANLLSASHVNPSGDHEMTLLRYLPVVVSPPCL